MKRFFLLLFVLGWLVQPGQAQPRELDFQHIFDNTFRTEGIRNINWMKDGQYYTTLNRVNGDIEIRKYDILTGEYEVLLSTSELKVPGRDKPIIIQDYQFSADESKLLIKTDIEAIWRRSTRENYFIYNFETGKTQKLTRSDEKQQYAQLSPSGQKAAFVQDNNLYWVDLKTGRETAITTDGEHNKIINGAADWVYEEEFGFARAWYWSPDGQKIAFYRFDESEVEEFVMMDWKELYPGLTRFKYPKAGEQNSTVKIGVYDLQEDETTWMDIDSGEDQYIPRINWTQSPETLAIRRMNRLQNQLDLMLADVNTGQTTIIKQETSKAWIDVSDDLKFLENGREFVFTSEESGYNHIYLYDMDGDLVRQVTKGDWEVTNYLGFNEDTGRFYYMSTEESPLQRHLYSIRGDGSRKKKLTDGDGWNEINMSRDFKYYIETFSTPDLPPQYTLHDISGKEIRLLEDNTELKKTLAGFQLPTKEFIKIPLEQATLNGYIMKPHDFDPEKKYPVLFYVYGGPGSQTVQKNFGSGQRPMWHRYLTTQGYIVVSVDNRGTGGRGRAFEQQVYKKLGQYEVTDQIEAAKYLMRTYDYIDRDRLGIWGWSYGGFMSSLALARGSEVFSTGIAVAPVTSWRFYDTIYTERFMQTPQMNPEGYREGSPLTYAHLIEGDYLLVHGTGDDNVHFQNTIEMINRLVSANVSFETMYYPNRNHGIYGGNTREHLYDLLNDYILEHL
ncbi:S9 family peptidase [Fodinibius sediminis]|uniref:Dipeptidyl-peptidase-4 n=1 Tax=Fodinibius sediminis TaxID=1214077 RepID=A0A521E0N9_9BACT|nr:S9 family peptidase [Fodinibius sediminis]SMO76881.1 dipeptidyl-peptidase-4 [Fodinibius sediminis]